MAKGQTLEAQIPIYWVPVLESLYKFILSIAQGPTIWVAGLLGKDQLESRQPGLLLRNLNGGFP